LWPVAVDVLHVDVEVNGSLRAVEQNRNATGMRAAHDLLHRHQRAEHVRHVGDRHHLGARRKQLLEFLDEEIAVVVDRRPFDHRPLPLAQEMPRHHVGMMLHDREHDLVAGLDAFAPEGVGDEVDGLGGVAGEDDFFLAGGIEEGAHLLARVLIGLGRGVGEVMQSAMHIGVFGGVGAGEPLQHRVRLLRRGGVVEIDERLAVHLHGEDGKILANALDIVGAVLDRRMHVLSSRFSPVPSPRGAALGATQCRPSRRSQRNVTPAP
jgi:hypothetical protein